MTQPDTTSPRGFLRLHLAMVGAMTALFLLVWQMPVPPALRGIASYLPIHIALETFAIVVAMLVFGVTWNAYNRERAGNVVIIACTMLAVGLLDFAHLLSFRGMPDFVTPADAEKAIAFWLPARFFSACGLLAAALRPWGPLSRAWHRHALLATGLAATALIYWMVLFHQPSLPRTFVEGVGLTPLKIGMEWLIVGLLTVPAVAFFFQARRGVSHNAASLFVAAAISILSELSFTLYKDVNDVFNLLGHVYKVIAYLFLYRAIFVDSVREPFRRMAAAELRYHLVFTEARDGILLVSAETGLILDCNPEFEHQSGRPLAELKSMHIWDLRPAEQRAAARRLFEEIRDTGEDSNNDLDFERPDGTHVRTEFLARRIGNGTSAQVLSVHRDISERRLMEQALRDSEERFRALANGAPDGIVLIDSTGTVVFWNRAAETLFGYSTGEAIGRPLHELVTPPHQLEAAARGMEKFAATGTGPMIGTTTEFETLRKDGTTFTAEHSITALRIGGVWHAMGTVRDTTQRSEMQRSLEHQLDELRRFQEVAVGRELRIKAVLAENEWLKARIDSLTRAQQH